MNDMHEDAGKPVEVDSVWLRQLKDRVTVAERVCGLVGINGSDRSTERGKALTQAWMEWVHVYGGQSVKVTDNEVRRLAAERDQRVAETLERLARDYPEITASLSGIQDEESTS
jgi:hypothetical protein